MNASHAGDAGLPAGARRITSRDNATWKEVVACAESARERRKRGASFLEGEHLCDAWLGRNGSPRLVVVAEGALGSASVRALLERAAPARAVVVDDAMWRDASQLAQGASLAFVVDTPRPALPSRVTGDAVFLDRLQDPGNVGSILRSAAAAGVRTLVTAPGTAWAWSPKVLRAGMGAHFALEIHESVGWQELAGRVAVRRLATRAQDATPIWDADLRAPALWLFGNEGAGLDAAIESGADDQAVEWVSIPQAEGVESLNVSAAAAVCLFEQRRQRMRG